MPKLDAEVIREDFPIFKTTVNGKPFTYLDSAATSQKPKAVIDAISDYYETYNSSIGHGAHTKSEKATVAFEAAKSKVASLIKADSIDQIVYTRNTTEALNMLALSWGEKNISKGDRILLSQLEHHSNIIPWMILARRKGAAIDYIKLNEQGTELDDESIGANLEKSPKIVSISQCSNVLGTINDVKGIAKKAHQRGAVVAVDGAQSVPHMETDVRSLDCDFLAFSGHKTLGPTGIGVLYGKKELLEGLPPVYGGCHMGVDVDFEGFTTNSLPQRLEAGTANIEGGIVLGTAIDYLAALGLKNIREHEKELTKYALGQLSDIKGVSVAGLGPDAIERRTGIISFSIEGVKPSHIAASLDREGIAIRAGHHCAMPLVKEVLKKEDGLARMSFYVYSSGEDVDRAVAEIRKIAAVR